jgi:hypothetical protein
MRVSGLIVLAALLCANAFAQEHPVASPSSIPTDKPRVFITDSQSWETRSSAGGSGGNWGAQSHGGARPQTAEIIKTFGERCPEVTVNNRQDIADYIVLLDHEGGKGYLQHRNKVAVFERESGDAVISHSTLSLGGSVQDACEGIVKHWSQHAAQIRAAEKPGASPQPATPISESTNKSSAVTKLNVMSTPDGADIEIDGSFVGSTPSAVELTPGDHQVVVKKSGYKPWERKLKISGGDIKLSAELEKIS